MGQRVPPQPVPTIVGMQLVQLNQEGQPPKWVLAWEWSTSSGTGVYFTDHELASTLRDHLNQHLAGWPGELVVAGAADLEAVRQAIGGSR